MALWSSIRFSLRILRKHWKLTSIAIFSLAIAMAAGAVGFSIFNALLLRPPAVPAPAQLVSVYASTPTEEFNGICYDDYKYYRDNNHVFSDVLAFPYSISVRPMSYQRPDQIRASSMLCPTTISLFSAFNRCSDACSREAMTTSHSELAVLSYPYWRWLGADPNIVGKTVSVNNVQLTIVGVMPKGFVGTIFSDLPDVWYPLSTEAALHHQTQDWRSDRTARPLRLVGRLKLGVTRKQVLADLETLSKRLASAYPKTNKDRLAHVTDTKHAS